jgi:uncharacterized protein (DUF2267 family)
MGYRELIKEVQRKSGFSDAESQDALDMMVESLAERLEEGERKDFASQLPPELQDIALSAETSREIRKKDIVQEFMERENIDEPHAKKQVLSAWSAIKSLISEGEIRHIKAQLHHETAALLY